MSTGKNRLQSIDFLRGLVMIVMALDHVRDLFTNAAFSPTNIAAIRVPKTMIRRRRRPRRSVGRRCADRTTGTRLFGAGV